jgi:hypothetical protein
MRATTINPRCWHRRRAPDVDQRFDAYRLDLDLPVYLLHVHSGARHVTVCPPPRPDTVPRPRLLERLNVGLRRKLTLISAPAGFGKTTLAGE